MKHRQPLTRLLAALLATFTIALACGVTPAWAAAVTINGETGQQLQDKLDEIFQGTASGNVFTLSGGTVQGSSTLQIDGGSVTIDLKGQTSITPALTSIIVKGGNLTINNSDEDNPSTVDGTTITVSGGTLNVKGGTQTATLKGSVSLNKGSVAIDSKGILEGNTTAQEGTLTVSAGGKLKGALSVTGASENPAIVTATINGNHELSSGTNLASIATSANPGSSITYGGTSTVTGAENAGGAVFSVAKGTLSYGSGSGITAGATQYAATVGTKAGTLKVTNGTLTGGGTTAAAGVKVTEGGTVEISGSAAINGGTGGTGAAGISADAKATKVLVSGGSVTGSGSAGNGIETAGAPVEISGGKVIGAGDGIKATADTTITVSGTSTVVQGGSSPNNDGIDLAQTNSTLNISGGTISGNTAIYTGNQGDSNKDGKANITITGSCVLDGSPSAVTFSGKTLTVNGSITSNASGQVIKAIDGTVNVSSNANIVASGSATGVSLETDGTNTPLLFMSGGKVTAAQGKAISVAAGTANIYGGNVSSNGTGLETSNNGTAIVSGNANIATTGSDTAHDFAISATGGNVTLTNSSTLSAPSKGQLVNKTAGTVQARSTSNTDGTDLNTYNDPSGANGNVVDYNANIDPGYNPGSGPSTNPDNPGTGGGTTIPNEPQKPGVPHMTVYAWPGATAANQNGAAVEGQTNKFTFSQPATPSRPGYVWLGWYLNTGTAANPTWSGMNWSTQYDDKANISVTGQWAKVAVTLDPSSQVVAPGAQVQVKASYTLTSETSGISIPSGTSASGPTFTTSPECNPSYTPSTSTISFTAPTTQPTTVTLNVAYAGGTNDAGSGFASALVYVADPTVVNVVSGNAAWGSATKSTTVGDSGRLTLTAQPADGYAFTGWTFTPAAGVNASQATAGIDLKSLVIEPLTYAGTWTADFQLAETVTVYRLYNPYLSGAHLLTADQNEITTLVRLGWQNEGPRYTQYKNAGSTGAPVYRLYNENNGDHFFTASLNEVNTLVGMGLGWKSEGIAWYQAISRTVPVYRLYNPYQTANEGLGNHLWTLERNEVTTLTRLGWLSEGTGWYAVAAVI